MLKRRAQPTPPPSRDPHPDARVEVQLQQILSLRRAAARNEHLLDDYRDNVVKINDAIRRNSGSDWNPERRKDVSRMNAEITRLNQETAELHAQVQELCAKVSDDDLLWLDPHRRAAP